MRIRFGLIGAGTWGQTHAKVYSTYPDVEFAAVCDVDEAKARKLARQYRAERVFTDFKKMIAEAEIDAVGIATPDFAHEAPIERAARAGKHIIVEKPLATTLEQAKRLAGIVHKAGIKFMVDFHNRWNPPFYWASRSIDRGEIGRPLSAYIRLLDTIYVPTRMLSWAARTSPLWFLGSHCLDLLRWMIRDEVKTVYSVSRSLVLKGLGIDTADFFHTVFQFKGGAVAVMEAGWILPESEPSLIDFRMDLVGSEGAINIDASHNRLLQKYTKDRASYPNVFPMEEIYGKEQGFALESIRDFVDCIIEDREPRAGLKDGLINTQVLAAAEQSASSGNPVTVNVGD